MFKLKILKMDLNFRNFMSQNSLIRTVLRWNKFYHSNLLISQIPNSKHIKKEARREMEPSIKIFRMLLNTIAVLLRNKDLNQALQRSLAKLDRNQIYFIFLNRQNQTITNKIK